MIKIENEYYARGGTLYNDIDKLIITVGDDSSSESEDAEIEHPTHSCTGISGNISGVEYLDSE